MSTPSPSTLFKSITFILPALLFIGTAIWSTATFKTTMESEVARRTEQVGDLQEQITDLKAEVKHLKSQQQVIEVGIARIETQLTYIRVAVEKGTTK